MCLYTDRHSWPSGAKDEKFTYIIHMPRVESKVPRLSLSLSLMRERKKEREDASVRVRFSLL